MSSLHPWEEGGRDACEKYGSYGRAHSAIALGPNLPVLTAVLSSDHSSHNCSAAICCSSSGTHALLCTVHTVYSSQCTVHIGQCIVHCAQCTVHSVHFTVHSVHALDSSHSGRLLIACPAHAAQIPNTASSGSSKFAPQHHGGKKGSPNARHQLRNVAFSPHFVNHLKRKFFPEIFQSKHWVDWVWVDRRTASKLISAAKDIEEKDVFCKSKM